MTQASEKVIWATVPLLGSMILLATQASAQEMYDSSVPSEGDVLKEVPAPMTINFLEGIHLTEVRLVGSGRTLWPLDWAKTEEDVFKVELRAVNPLPPGKYQIEWLAYVRQHYHPDGGVITFTIAPQGTTDESVSTTQAPTPQAGGAPLAARGWPYLVPRAGAAPPADR